MKKNILRLCVLFFCFFTYQRVVFATSPPNQWIRNITLKYEFNNKNIDLNQYPQFFILKKEYFLNQKKIIPQKFNFCLKPNFCTRSNPKGNFAEVINPLQIDEDVLKTLKIDYQKTNQEIEIKETWEINLQEIENFLKIEIAPLWEKEKQDVKIFCQNEINEEKTKDITTDLKKAENLVNKNAEISTEKEKQELLKKKIKSCLLQFEGVGKFEEKINLKQSAQIIKKTIIENLKSANLSFTKTPPKVEVASKLLQEAGIKELISIGQSDFSSSPLNRIYNIKLGAEKMNGKIIFQGETFSFNQNIGQVNYKTGFKPELVIKGEHTVPEYGGGLCQLSTTFFRSAMLAGLPIKERWAHAYAVKYYQPWGSDATIYIGGKDLKFTNDTNSIIAVQTRVEDNLLFVHFYGQKDKRLVFLLGPKISDWQPALKAKTIISDTLTEGEEKKLSGSHPGFNALWFRIVEKITKNTISNSTLEKPNLNISTESAIKSEKLIDKFFSIFQARGIIKMISKKQQEEKINNE